MFKPKFLVIQLALACCLVPAAALGQGAKGEGMLRNSSGQVAHFKMWVSLNSMSPVAPYFNFEMPSTTTNVPGVSIQMRDLRSLTVNGRVCEFKAAAVMRRPHLARSQLLQLDAVERALPLLWIGAARRHYRLGSVAREALSVLSLERTSEGHVAALI
jgi:hypothetical protein